VSNTCVACEALRKHPARSRLRVPRWQHAADTRSATRNYGRALSPINHKESLHRAAHTLLLLASDKNDSWWPRTNAV
jgi:hypothetical protein